MTINSSAKARFFTLNVGLAAGHSEQVITELKKAQ